MTPHRPIRPSSTRPETPPATSEAHPGRPRTSRLRRHVGLGACALAFVVAGCSSSGSTSSKTTAGTAGAGSSTGAKAASAGGTGKGTIAIGDVNQDLKVTRCVNMSGAIAGDAVSVSEPDNVKVSFSFSPNDWQKRNASEGWTNDGDVRLDSDEPYAQWQTGPEAMQGINLPNGIKTADAAITSYKVADDGQSVKGEAKFVDMSALGSGDMKLTSGTFSFSCPPKN